MNIISLQNIFQSVMDEEDSIIEGYNVQIIWLDQNQNEENTKLDQWFQKQYSVNYHRFENQQEFYVFFNSLKNGSQAIILTNATIGREIAKKIPYDIIFFCGNSTFHTDFFNQNKNIIYMIDSGINEVKELIQFYHNQKQNQILLQQLFNPEILMKENYTHSSQKLNIAFYIILEYCLQTKSSENEIFKEMLKLIPGQDSQQQLLNKIESQKLTTAFQKLVFSYTTKFIYRSFNNQFAKFEYLPIQHTIKCLFEGFKTNICCKNTLLHRGLNFSKEQKQDFIQIYQSLTQGLDEDKVFYWNTLVSTSLNFDIAYNFKYQNVFEGGFGISFQIYLIDYPALIIPQNLTEFPEEEEVLIFPQFPFKVTKINLVEQNFLEVTIKQVKKTVEFSLDDAKRKNYWRKVFEEKIVRKLYNTIDSHFYRVQFILDRYFLFKKKEIEEMGKQYLQNEMKRSIEKIEDTFEIITRTISNLKIVTSFSSFFRCLKQEINLSNDYGEIKLQLHFIQSLILEKTVQIIQTQVFNLEEVKNSLKNIKNKHGILKRIPQIAYPFDYLRQKALTYFAAVEAVDIAKLKIMDANILGSIENVSLECKEYLNELMFAQYYFSEFTNILERFNLISPEAKVIWDECFHFTNKIPQILQTHFAVVGTLASIIAEVTIQGFSFGRIANGALQLAVTSLPYLQYFEKVNQFLLNNPTVNTIFGWGSTIFVSALQLTPLLMDQNLSGKEKGFRCSLFCLNLLANISSSYVCSTVGSIGGPVGFLIGGIVGAYFGNLVNSKLQSMTQLSVKIKINEKNFKNGEQQAIVPYMKIKKVLSAIKYIIIIGLKGSEYKEFFCWIIREVYLHNIDIIIPEGANRQDQENCFYLAPELQNKGKLKFVVYGVADTNLNKKLLKDWLLKKKDLQIIDQCEINA